MRSLLVLASLAALVAAGCIAPASNLAKSSLSAPDANAAFAKVATLLQGVPCTVSSVDNAKTSANLKTLATVPYEDGDHGEIDARGDWLLAARYAGGGFEVVSIADPTTPVKVATYQSQEKSAFDVKWMPDNETAVVGHRGTVDLVDVSPVLNAASPDVVEKQNITPKLLYVWKYPGAMPPGSLETNMHMLTTARIGGTDYVFIAPNDDAGVMVLKLTGTGDGRQLATVGRIGDDVLTGGPLGPHDMSLVWDQLTNKPVLYVANGFEGWKAFDVSDPAHATLLAVSLNFGAAQGYTHTVVGQKVGSKRLVAAIQEVGDNTLTIYDATNWMTPVPIAQWKEDATDPLTPEHNIQLLNGTLYVSHYTHGMFVFDLNKLDTTPLLGTLSLQPVAHYEPTKPQSASGPLAFANIWDVLVNEGVVYVNDIQGGTDVVGYGCLHPGDASETSVN
jgi:hypothetical protein